MRFILSLIIVVSMFFVLLNTAVALPCSQQNAYVCGSSPNSAIGYGAVDICGDCHTCGGEKDGVCPEDFYSSVAEQRPSCRLCPDPDCTADTISGTVTYTDGNTPIPGAKVYAFYPPNQKVEIATTEDNGMFSAVNNVPSGVISFFAEYSDFDSPMEKVEIGRNKNHTVNFALEKGTCQSTCAGSFGLRCKARCDGMNGCAYQSGSGYTSSEIAKLCDEKLINERVTLEVADDHVTYVTCCTGEITTVTRPKVNVKFVEGSNIKDLVTQKVRAKYKGESVNLVIAYWNEETR